VTDTDAAVARSQERLDAVSDDKHKTWTNELLVAEEAKLRLANAQKAFDEAKPEDKASKQANLDKQTAKATEASDAVASKMADVRESATQAVEDRKAAAVTAKERLEALDPAKAKAADDELQAQRNAVAAAEAAYEAEGEGDKKEELKTELANAQLALDGATAKAYPGMVSEMKVLNDTSAKLVKAEVKAAKYGSDLEKLDTEHKAAEEALATKEKEVRDAADIAVGEGETAVAVAEEAVKAAMDAVKAAEDKLVARTPEEKEAVIKANQDASKAHGEAKVAELKGENQVHHWEHELSIVMGQIAVAEGRSQHPEHDTIETCAEAVLNTEAVEYQKQRLETMGADCDEQHEIDDAQKKLKQAELRAFMSMYGKISVDEGLLDAPDVVKAKAALRRAQEKEEMAEGLIERPPPNKDGTINIQLVAAGARTPSSASCRTSRCPSPCSTS